jgi:hypothetical protein
MSEIRERKKRRNGVGEEYLGEWWMECFEESV